MKLFHALIRHKQSLIMVKEMKRGEEPDEKEVILLNTPRMVIKQRAVAYKLMV
jgi:hypothetical protein